MPINNALIKELEDFLKTYNAHIDLDKIFEKKIEEVNIMLFGEGITIEFKGKEQSYNKI